MRDIVPMACSEFISAPLLEVPPASRGEPSVGSVSAASRGEPRKSLVIPASRGEPNRASVRFPLLAGGTLRRGLSVVCIALLLCGGLPAQQPTAPSVRLKDIAQIRGVRCAGNAGVPPAIPTTREKNLPL